MLDEKDIQIIAQLLSQHGQQLKQDLKQELKQELRQELMQDIRQEMDVRFTQQKQDIMGEMDVHFTQQKQDIMHEVKLLMENYFDPKFNALADGLEMLKEKTLSREELEECSDRLDVLEAVAKVHSREIEKLKKAQSA